MSVAMGFLCALNESMFSSLEMAISRKLMLLFISSSLVNVIGYYIH